MAHITFIHGISNKPEKEALLAVWQSALRQSALPLDLAASDVSSEMVYWADVLYQAPLADDAGLEIVGLDNDEFGLAQPGDRTSK